MCNGYYRGHYLDFLKRVDLTNHVWNWETHVWNPKKNEPQKPKEYIWWVCWYCRSTLSELKNEDSPVTDDTRHWCEKCQSYSMNWVRESEQK